MGNIYSKQKKNEQLEDKDISVKSNASSTTTQSILKNSSYTSLVDLQTSQSTRQGQASERQPKEPNRWQKFLSIKTKAKSDVRIKRKSISAKGNRGIQRLDENLDGEHYEQYKQQQKQNKHILDRENELIHKELKKDIKDFLASDELNSSVKKPLFTKVGNKILDLLSEEKYPQETEVKNEDGDTMYDRFTKEPLAQYNSANYLSIPRYFYTTEGTWNTIAMHIQSNDTVSNNSLDESYPHTEENIKDFLGELGNFVLSKTDEQTKNTMLKHLDPEGSDAERYRHFVERKAYKTVHSQIEDEKQTVQEVRHR